MSLQDEDVVKIVEAGDMFHPMGYTLSNSILDHTEFRERLVAQCCAYTRTGGLWTAPLREHEITILPSLFPTAIVDIEFTIAKRITNATENAAANSLTPPTKESICQQFHKVRTPVPTRQSIYLWECIASKSLTLQDQSTQLYKIAVVSFEMIVGSLLLSLWTYYYHY